MKPAVNDHQKPYCNKVQSKFLWNSHRAIHGKVPWCASQHLIPNSSNTDSMSFTYSSYNYVAPRPAACQPFVQIQIRKCSIRYFGFQLALYSRAYPRRTYFRTPSPETLGEPSPTKQIISPPQPGVILMRTQLADARQCWTYWEYYILIEVMDSPARVKSKGFFMQISLPPKKGSEGLQVPPLVWLTSRSQSPMSPGLL